MNDHENGDLRRGSALLVCSANVCRSPLAAATMTAAAVAGGMAVHFSSAGIAAQAGSPMCHVAARSVPEEPADHHARPVTADIVAGADMILTMERAQRGSIARTAPGSQARTFTLPEADALLALAARRIQEGALERVDSLREASALLHSLRGQLPLQTPSRRRGTHSTPGEWLNIPDGHNAGRSAHAETITGVQQVGARVVAGLMNVLTVAGTDETPSALPTVVNHATA